MPKDPGGPWPRDHAPEAVRQKAKRPVAAPGTRRHHASTVMRKTGWSGEAASSSASVDFAVIPWKY